MLTYYKTMVIIQYNTITCNANFVTLHYNALPLHLCSITPSINVYTKSKRSTFLSYIYTIYAYTFSFVLTNKSF